MKPARLTRGKKGREKEGWDDNEAGNGAYFRVEFIWQMWKEEYKPQRDHLSTERLLVTIMNIKWSRRCHGELWSILALENGGKTRKGWLIQL